MKKKYYLIFLLTMFRCYAMGQNLETWGASLDICSSFQSSSTFLSGRYFIAGGQNTMWMNEISTGYNFDKIMKNSFTTSFAPYIKPIIMPCFGASIDYFLVANQSYFFISPLIRLDTGFIALEYSRKINLGNKVSDLIYPNSITIILRPKLLLYPFMK